jgi:hypothetical protein
VKQPPPAVHYKTWCAGRTLHFWISRLQKREYTLRATGWVRSVAGLQSLLSVYLLALWVLTYFGRPFD